MTEAEALGIVEQEAAKLGPIDKRTCRPIGVYGYADLADGNAVDYVRRFGEALGLTPAPTRFGARVVTL